MYAFTHRAPPVINSFFTSDGAAWTPEPGARLEMDAAAGLESAGVKDAAVARLADGGFFMVYVTEIDEPPAGPLAWDLDFRPDPGIRVDNASLPKPGVDQKSLRLPDGRYRMYVAAAVEAGLGQARFVIVSASTNVESPGFATLNPPR